MTNLPLLESDYIVKQAKIVRVKQLTELEKYFEIVLPGGEDLNHQPGQFVMVSIPGAGDAPISVSSSPTKLGTFELVVRKVGKLTGALHQMKPGDTIGIRGPFGEGFPVGILEGNDLLLVAGGLGIVPLRSLINFVIDKRRDFGKVHILLGCKTPKDMLFSDEAEAWSKSLDLEFNCTVDKSDPEWKGNVGLITEFIPGINLDPDRTFAIVVGPPVMYKFVITKLLDKGIPDNQIILSLERHMKCGVGKCGHCQIGQHYCCQSGPAFSYNEIKKNVEAL